VLAEFARVDLVPLAVNGFAILLSGEANDNLFGVHFFLG